MPLIDEQFAKTRLDADTYSFNWTLENYKQLAYYKGMNEYIQSPTFVLYNQSCYIRWFPSGNNQLKNYSPESEYASARIYCKKISDQLSDRIPVNAKSFFSILTNSGQKHLETSTTTQVRNTKNDWFIPNFIETIVITAENSDLLIDGSIKLRFELKVFSEDTLVTCNSMIPLSTSAERNEFINFMEKLFLLTEFSDVKFKFVTEGGKELPAHKIILVFRVPFFEKMFQCNMKENITNVIEITDIDSNIIKEMLRFIYTRKVENMSAVASDLIMVADKYGIDSLKNKCAKHLRQAMNIENVINIHEVAKLCNVDYLKNQALDFIKSNFHELVKLYTHETMAAISNNIGDDTMSGVNGDDHVMDEDESRSEATFRLSVNNFSKMKDAILSRSFFVRNLPWKIRVGPKTKKTQEQQLKKSLSIFLQCDGESDSTSWSCYAVAKLKLLSCKKGQKPFCRTTDSLFCREHRTKGFYQFRSWQDVLDPNGGYIENDTITFEVHVVAGAPRQLLEQ